MRGTFTFSPDLATGGINCKADLYEMTQQDLLKLCAAMTEQALVIQTTLLKKLAEKDQASRIIQVATNGMPKV